MRKLNKKVSISIGVVVVLIVVGLFFYQDIINLFTPSVQSNSSTDITTLMQNQQDQNQNSSSTVSDNTQGQVANTSTQSGQTTLSDGLIIQDEIVGTGQTAQTGDTVTVNYIGTFQNGTVFDSSYSRNQPFNFTLGAGQVIQGWDEGVVGMKVGGKRELIIPPSLAYGVNGYGPIPANSTLIFQVELLGIANQ